MKKLSKIMALIMTLLITGTVFSQASSDYDKTVDFTKFKTYSFGGWQEDSDKMLNDLDKNRIHEAFETEFKSRGMTYVESNADMVVTLFLVVDQKTSTTAYTSYNGGMGYGGYGGYGRGGAGYHGAGWGWGAGSSTTTYSDSDYDVGTLVIDGYDSGSKQLVWQGTLVKTLKSNASKRDKTIPKNVAKLMKKYPVEAMK